MKISEMIAALEAIREDHGDLEVEKYGPGERAPVFAPTVAYRLTPKPGETRNRFWNFAYPFERKGEKVCRVG